MNVRLEPAIAAGRRLRFSIRRRARAFTMLELMIVCAIMFIILAMGVPAIISATHRDPMSQAIVDITDACEGSAGHAGARSVAIMNGKQTLLRIFPRERRIQADGGFSATFSDRVTFRFLDVNFMNCLDQDYAEVRFYPNGTCDEFTLILQADTGESRKITLDAITSRPQVSNIQ
jgi:Prokaryotic N-terminal methylation motif